MVKILSSRAEIGFALFDSRLDQLKLPVIRPPSQIFHGQDEGTSQPLRLESVAGLVQKYFEWFGIFDKCERSLLLFHSS